MRGKLGFGRRESAADSLLAIARQVVGREMPVQAALAEVRDPRLLDRLTGEAFAEIDRAVQINARGEREFAVVAARLALAAAREKGASRQAVDALLRLDELLPGEDPARERDRLLQEAWTISERAGYVAPGREALHRLGMRALAAGETERAKDLLRQQLATGEETADGRAEIAAAIALGDWLRREGQRQEAQALYRRAGRAAQRLDDPHAIAEALSRQIDLLPETMDGETLAALQQQATGAARRTSDLGLQSRLLLSLAGTLERNGRFDEAAAQLGQGVEVAVRIGDLALEARCRTMLAGLAERRGRVAAAAEQERLLFSLEERLGNRAAAAGWGIRVGTSLLDAGDADGAVEAFGRAAAHAAAAGDRQRAQRAAGGLGVALARAGQPGESLEQLMRALELARLDRDAAAEARWLTQLAETLWRFGRLEDALRPLRDATGIARRMGDAHLEATLLLQAGRLHFARGHAPRAREALARAIEARRRIARPDDEPGDLAASLAGLAWETGQAHLAQQLFGEALAAAGAAGDRAGAARLHLRLAEIGARRGDAGLALEHLGRAVGEARSAGDPGLLRQVLRERADSLRTAARPEAADAYREAILHGRETGDRDGEASLTVDLGLCLAALGRADEASIALREGVDLARRLGPGGAELARRADEALVLLAERRFGALARRPDRTPDRPADGGDAGQAEEGGEPEGSGFRHETSQSG